MGQTDSVPSENNYAVSSSVSSSSSSFADGKGQVSNVLYTNLNVSFCFFNQLIQ